jgi:hypothetical protein
MTDELFVRPATIVSLNAALVLAAVTVVAAAPRPGPVLVLTSPGSTAASSAAVVLRAGGRFVASTGRDWILLAEGDDPGFVDRLYGAGALLVLDGHAFRGCSEQR